MTQNLSVLKIEEWVEKRIEELGIKPEKVYNNFKEERGQ